MIFQHTSAQIPTGEKTATRRKLGLGQRVEDGVLYSATGRRLHWVGQSVSVQPGRGKKAIGRVTITALYIQHLSQMTEADAIKEGCRGENVECDVPEYGNTYRLSALSRFRALWTKIHNPKKGPWNNYPVVVFEFLPVNPAQEQAQ